MIRPRLTEIRNDPSHKWLEPYSLNYDVVLIYFGLRSCCSVENKATMDDGSSVPWRQPSSVEMKITLTVNLQPFRKHKNQSRVSTF